MKVVLVATDFSKAGKNASDFAALLCRKTGARMILFHSYKIPVPVNETAMIGMGFIDVEEDVKELLQKEATRIKKETGLRVEVRLAPGFAVEEIERLQEELRADLIVMGIVHTGPVSEFVLGSITTTFMNRSRVPILVIPEGVSYSQPHRILFACDYGDKTNSAVLHPLKELAAFFSSRIYILNVLKERGDFPVEKSMAGIRMDEYLDTINHIYYFPEEEDIAAEIDYFVTTHKVDWVVMVPHHHNWYERLIRKSETRKYLFHANRPVLVIPDSIKPE